MRYLFNGGWRFLETGLDTTFGEIKTRKDEFKKVKVPHDWLIYDSKDLFRDGLGWYTKDFEFRREQGSRCFITFEGIYMDSEIYVNGQSAWCWKYGYSSFTFEMTEYLVDGNNNITVSVRHQSPNSRWYSGAGIYRDIWINITQDTCILNDGVYLSAVKKEDDYILTVETEAGGKDAANVQIMTHIEGVTYEEIEACEAEAVAAPACDYRELESGQLRYRYVNRYLVRSPQRWDIDTPYLYEIKVELVSGGRTIDEYRTGFGFRDIVLDPDRGFIINGRNIKLNGVCEHHDLGALGSAYNSKAMRRKLIILKKMGVNAIRGTHNMAAPNVLDLLDEMGFIFISEAFDMWKKPKTEYDYARFFDKWHERVVASWVRRDRNHACLAFFSIGNEIYDTHAGEDGLRTTGILKELVQKYDRHRNAYPTIGSNYMPWENAQKCADILKIVGYNYAEKYYEEHHRAHPDWVIYGSETSSIVSSRGIYHFPAAASVLSDDDEQCSSLGNSQTSWGAKSIESCIRVDRDTPFSMGQFLWTGFDYIGEPTPYQTKNSYFGQIDTAGFPKDAYYEWQAAWTDCKKVPMIHICPSYWDFNEGQTIDLRIVTNAPKAELYINGESMGCHDFSNRPASGSRIEWNLQVPYQKGCVEARALDEKGKVIATDIIRNFGEAVELRIRDESRLCDMNNGRAVQESGGCQMDSAPSASVLTADTNDLVFLEISALDKDGNEVLNAQNRVSVTVTGQGRLVGLDNGDSTDYDSYKGTRRRLFGGKLLAIIETTDKEGDIKVSVSSPGLKTAGITLRSSRDCTYRINYYEPPEVAENNAVRDVILGKEDEIPVRKIELINESGSNVLTKENNEIRVSARVLPENASYKDITFQIGTEYGAKSNRADLATHGNTAVIKARGDGRFYLRAVSRNGSDKIRLISYLDFEVKGMGPAFLDPYSFVSGSLYSGFEGEAGNGNDKGVATARGQRTLVTFDKLDFGRDSADKITIPVFATDGGACRIRIWSGNELILEEIYDRPPMWNVYQEVTWKLKRPLSGICNISFETRDKLHIKGFVFNRNKRAFADHCASDADEIYGDSFKKDDAMISEIGNNVSLVFRDMNFGDDKPSKITIIGRARNARNTIHLLFESDDLSTRQILEIDPCDEISEHTFKIDNLQGDGTVTFVFLPGSSFDMKGFRFE